MALVDWSLDGSPQSLIVPPGIDCDDGKFSPPYVDVDGDDEVVAQDVLSDRHRQMIHPENRN